MNRILGVGAAEALLILLIAVVVLGPHRMIRAAFNLGRLIRELSLYSKRILGSLRQQLATLDDIQETLGNSIGSGAQHSESPQESSSPDAEGSSQGSSHAS